MYKEPCPQCHTPFPFFGPRMGSGEANKPRSHARFHCPACGCPLERRISRGEKALLFGGSVALLLASLLSLLQVPAQPLTKALFLCSALVGIIEIRNEWVRRRFHVAADA